MESSTNIINMLTGSYITVPNYQRAYSWDVDKQVKQFLEDIDDYIASKSSTFYYFGHFLFEDKTNQFYEIIDGQQRLTTIIIFLSAVFTKLESLRILTDTELEYKDECIKKRSKYKFSTVDYDNPFFKDYVIDQTKNNTIGFNTVSSKRIAAAFDYFKSILKEKTEQELVDYYNAVLFSTCTTHKVEKSAEAIQMFIFQNNRGKLPTKLEIIKAQFMYEIQISGLDNDTINANIQELQERFENIYKSIATIEHKIDEDDVLLYALRVYFNDFNIDVSTKKIEKELKKEFPVDFVMKFTLELENSFENIKPFFLETKNYATYSFALLGKTQMMPFVIKAYEYGISESDKSILFSALESLVLRHRIIGTRAHIEDRIKDVYQNFTKQNPDINPIINRIQYLKDTVDWWWAYWNNSNFEEDLRGKIDHKIAKHILWKYENSIRLNTKNGYNFMLYEQIDNPELEHISPQTPKDEPVAEGYNDYTEEFINKYLDCIGNYLLISKSHNCSIGNVAFKEKRTSYTYLEQQKEIQNMSNDLIWDQNKIEKRQEKLVKYVKEHF